MNQLKKSEEKPVEFYAKPKFIHTRRLAKRWRVEESNCDESSTSDDSDCDEESSEYASDKESDDNSLLRVTKNEETGILSRDSGFDSEKSKSKRFF